MLVSLADMLKPDPFIPFRIVLTSGKEYEIVNPQLVALGQTQITVYAPKSDNWSILSCMRYRMAEWLYSM